MTRRTRILASIAPLALLAALPQAHAQDSGEAVTVGLGDIVVTAQRREESVQNVPIAISAFSPAELERRNITETLDLIQYIPNLFGSNNTGLGTANAYYIRALGNTESIATFDPPVGTYVDDIYISRQNANNFSFFDVERVEVLRGPQGTLFGRNTTGGAVNVVLAKPSSEWTGYAEASYGRYNEITARASVDIPLDEALMFKISGYFSDVDGYVNNLNTGEKWNGGRAYGVRGAARAILSENIEWNVAITHSESDVANILNFQCDNTSLAVNCNGRFNNTGLLLDNNGADQVPGLTLANGKDTLDGGNDVRSTMVTSNLQFDFDSVTINVITGYLKLDQNFLLDFADSRSGLASLATPEPTVAGFRAGTFSIANIGVHEQFTQEIKFNGSLMDGRIDYVAGGFYLKETNKTDFADIFVLPFAPAPTGFPLLLADRTLENEATAYAGFAQVDFNATDQLKLTAGIRYTDEEKTFDISDNRGTGVLTTANMLAATFTNGCQTAPCNFDTQRAKVWTPRIAANFQANDDVLLFASATRGFKSGGWNARGTAVNELLPFAPEKVWTYEGGLKSEWFGSTLRFNATVFYMDVKDLQVPSAFTRANGQLAFITRNFADLENYGLELEATWLPVDNLTLTAAGGLQNASYKIDRNAPEFDEFGIRSIASQQALCLGGDAASCGVGIVTPDGSLAEPVRAPDITLNGGASYVFETEAGSITPSVNVAYTGKLESGTSNLTFYRAADGTINTAGNGEFVTGSFKKAHVVVNAGLTWKSLDEMWRVSVECNNCFDEVWVQSSLANFTYISPPMTWTVRAKYSF